MRFHTFNKECLNSGSELSLTRLAPFCHRSPRGRTSIRAPSGRGRRRHQSQADRCGPQDGPGPRPKGLSRNSQTCFIEGKDRTKGRVKLSCPSHKEERPRSEHFAGPSGGTKRKRRCESPKPARPLSRVRAVKHLTLFLSETETPHPLNPGSLLSSIPAWPPAATS